MSQRITLYINKRFNTAKDFNNYNQKTRSKK